MTDSELHVLWGHPCCQVSERRPLLGAENVLSSRHRPLLTHPATNTWAAHAFSVLGVLL